MGCCQTDRIYYEGRSESRTLIVLAATLSIRNVTIPYLSFEQVCHANPSERARFIRCIYNLLNSSSPAVRYEAAGTLVTLSSAPTAVKVSYFLESFLLQSQHEYGARLVIVIFSFRLLRPATLN